MRRILSRPTVAYAPWVLYLLSLPKPLSLRTFTRHYADQAFNRFRGPTHMRRCFGVQVCLLDPTGVTMSGLCIRVGITDSHVV